MATNRAKQYVKLSEDGLILDLKLAHLQRHDFNPCGHIAPWRLAQILETARALGHYSESYFTSGLLKQDYTFFTVVLEYEMKPALYQLDNHRPFEKGMFVPIRLHHECLSFKNSSGIFKTTLFNDQSGIVMASLKFKYVLIDMRTRRPTQLPANLMKLIQSKTTQRSSPVPKLSYKIQHPPSDAYKWEYTVQASDTDLNKHTNNTTYVRLCWDTVAKACLENKLPWMKGGISEYRVMGMNIYYAKESKEGDKLEVYMWSNDDQQEIIHLVFRLEQRNIFHCTKQLKHISALLSANL